MDHPNESAFGILEKLESTDSVSEIDVALEDLCVLLDEAGSDKEVLRVISNSVVGSLLRKRRAEWFLHMKINQRLRRFLSLAEPEESIQLLLDFAKGSSPGSSRGRVAVELVQFYIDTVIGNFLLEAHADLSAENARTFIQLLTSIPDHISFLASEMKAYDLLPSKFYPKILDHVKRSLLKVYDLIKAQAPASLMFHGMLLGRLGLIGQADVVSTRIILPFLRKAQDDFVWRRITQTLFKNIPAVSQEAILKSVLCNLEHGTSLTCLLGFDVLNSGVNHVLTHKVYFNWILPVDKEVSVFRAALSFLCEADGSGERFKQVANEIFLVWSQGCSQKYLAARFELALTKAVLIALGILRECLPSDVNLNNKTVSVLLSGVAKRLSSAETVVRWNGMIVGEAVTTLTEMATAMKFDIPSNEITRELQDLVHCIPSADQGDACIKKPTWIMRVGMTTSDTEIEPTAEIALRPSEEQTIDSDDDIPACEGANDESSHKLSLAKPRYLQECYEGLLKRDDIPRRRISLLSLKELIVLHLETAEHLCEDLCKVLLGMELEGSMRDLNDTRIECLVCLTVNFPKLTGAFFGKEARLSGYGLGTRLEILKVIRTAVTEIANPSFNNQPVLPVDADRTVVASSLSCKTIKPPFSKTKKVEPTRSQLVNVAKCFILPLLRDPVSSSKKSQFGILEMENALILSHLINTMSVVILFAKDMPDTPALAVQVLEFAWDARTHPDPTVKHAVLMYIRVVVQTVKLEYLPQWTAKLFDELADFATAISRYDEHSNSVDMAAEIQDTLNKSTANLLTYTVAQQYAQSSQKSLTLQDVKDFAKSTQNMSFR